MIESLKDQIIGQLQACNDPDLLDLVLKLFISQS